MERVWIRYGDDCKRFVLVNGKLDLDRIAAIWKLDPHQLFLESQALTYEEGKSIENMTDICEGSSEFGGGDGKFRNTALVLEGVPQPDSSGYVSAITAVNLQNTLDAMRLEMREMKADSARTRSASKITVGDFSTLRTELKIVVMYEDIYGNKVGEDVLATLVGDDKFWGDLYERQEKERYMAEVKTWVEEGSVLWRDADGHTINRKFANAPFPVSGQNDQVAYMKGFGLEQGALMGVELKRRVITRKALRQAEIEFYLWGDASLFPFVQLVTDMQKGGVAMFCRSREADRIVLVQVILHDMSEVRGFTRRVLSHTPSDDDARYGDKPVEGIEPPRKKFRPVEKKLPEGEKTQGGSSSALSPSQRLLWTLGPQLLANENDVANLADLQCFDCELCNPAQGCNDDTSLVHSD